MRTFLSRLARPLFDKVLRRLQRSSLRNPYVAGKLVPVEGSERDTVVLTPQREEARTASDGLPVPPPHLLYGYGEQDYLETGRRDVETMLRILEAGGGAPDQLQRVLELGCGPARMLRAVPRRPESELWGVDISAPHVSWCQSYLTPPLRFATITTAPHLPFEDGSFDLAYAGSVFTHIVELADAWLLELLRVVREGGYLYATVHDEHTLELLFGEYRHDPDLEDVVRGIVRFDERTGIRARPFRQFSYGVDPESQVFYDRRQLVEKWSVFATVLSTTPRAYEYQTALLLQKRARR